MKNLAAGVVIVIAGFLAKQFLFPSDTERVLRVLADIEGESRLEHNDSLVDRLAKVRSVSNFLATEVTLILPQGDRTPIEGKQKIVDGLTWGQSHLLEFSAEFVDEVVTVSGTTAKVVATAKGTGRLKGVPEGRDDKVFEALEVELGLRKVNGKWLIDSIAPVEVIKP